MARNWCGSSEEREELNSSRKTEKGLENVDDDGGGRISLDVEYGYFGARKLECDRTRFKRRKTSCWEVHHGTIVWTQRTVVYSSTPSCIREFSSYPWPRSMTTDRCRGSASIVVHYQFQFHKWGLAQSPSCDCGQRQTMNHIVDTCPLTKSEGTELNLRTMTQSHGWNLQRLQHSRNK